MQLHTQRLRALGVLCQVTVDDVAMSDTATAILREEVDGLDVACSRFRGDSELTRLNRERHAVVSRHLFDAVLVGGYLGRWVATGRGVDGALRRITTLAAQIRRRGACGPPDFVASGLVTSSAEVQRHRRGECSATSGRAVLPTPRAPAVRCR